MIFHENFIKDWGPNGKLLGKILRVIKTLPDLVHELKSFLKVLINKDYFFNDQQKKRFQNSANVIFETKSWKIFTKDDYGSNILQLFVAAFKSNMKKA